MGLDIRTVGIPRKDGSSGLTLLKPGYIETPDRM
jgi:hypothetical protein